MSLSLEILTKSNTRQFAVDGEILPSKVEIHVRNRRNDFDIYLLDNSEVKILPAKLIDIPENVALIFKSDSSWENFLNKIRISIRRNWVLFNLSIDVSKWTEPYAIPLYINKYLEIINSVTEKNFELKILEKTFFQVYYKFSLEDLEQKTIGDELKEGLNILKNCHQKAFSELLSVATNKRIQAIFDFPEQLKNSCEQYLVYFAKFLKDIGIKATSDLTEKSGKVLFSVTPTGNIEALDRIREALAVYLNLPASPIVYDDSFAAMRLQQQVENLHHAQRMMAREIRASERELLLAQTVIEKQDEVIGQKDTLIEQQRKVIEKITDPAIMVSSAQNKEELEELYDGLKIGESEFLKKQLGIHINPAKVIKTIVKNALGKSDKESILGLDEE